MDIQSFFNQTEGLTINLEATREKQVERKLSNEALFQLPFISMTILFLSKGRSKPSVAEVGQKLGYAFERSFVAFKGSSQHVGWSSNMRLRTTTAVSFLELSKLVTVDTYNKEVSITELGKAVIEKVMHQEGNLKDNITVLCKNFNGLKKEDKVYELFYEAI